MSSRRTSAISARCWPISPSGLWSCSVHRGLERPRCSRLQLDHTRDQPAADGNMISLFVTPGAYPLEGFSLTHRLLEWIQSQWRGKAANCPRSMCSRRRSVLLFFDALNEMKHRDSDDFGERVESGVASCATTSRRAIGCLSAAALITAKP